MEFKYKVGDIIVAKDKRDFVSVVFRITALYTNTDNWYSLEALEYRAPYSDKDKPKDGWRSSENRINADFYVDNGYFDRKELEQDMKEVFNG